MAMRLNLRVVVGVMGDFQLDEDSDSRICERL